MSNAANISRSLARTLACVGAWWQTRTPSLPD